MRLMQPSNTPFIVSESTMCISNQEINQAVSLPMNNYICKGNNENINVQTQVPHDEPSEENDDEQHQHPHEQLDWGKTCLAFKSIDDDQKNVNACDPKYCENNPMGNHQGPSQSRCIKNRIFRRVCVFCGSQSGNNDVYGQASIELGKALVERSIALVYGGGSCGLMGIISKVVHDGGCHVIGILPKSMMSREISGETFGELRLVEDMHARKTQMAQLADAFITLPGGFGTLEELLEVITCSQLGIHNKPVGLLNVNGYYDSLLSLFDKFVEEGFITSMTREAVIHATTSKELIAKMEMFCSKEL